MTNFNISLFYETLNMYLNHLISNHDEIKSKIEDMNNHIEKTLHYLDDLDEYEFDLDAQKEKIELLEQETNYYHKQVTKLNDFSVSFPEEVHIINSTKVLNDILEYLISIEKYENCSIIKDLINIINE